MTRHFLQNKVGETEIQNLISEGKSCNMFASNISVLVSVGTELLFFMLCLIHCYVLVLGEKQCW